MAVKLWRFICPLFIFLMVVNAVLADRANEPAKIAAIDSLTVNSTNDMDDGACNASHCSLREAIKAANLSSNENAILFNIPTPPYVIQPLTPLPSILNPVIIDGTSQPGFSHNPLIALSGANAVSSQPQDSTDLVGINILTDNSTVRGLVINGWGYAGIEIRTGDGNKVEGNFIGTDAAGVNAVPNRYGIVISWSSDNVIGGITVGTLNLISGNSSDGIYIFNQSATHNQVLANTIGADISGTLPLGNGGNGVHIEDSPNNTVGARNLIAYNSLAGVNVTGAVGNFISSNSISNNGGLGIDLGGDGVTNNDNGDGDTGANNLQNFPRILSGYSNSDVAYIAGDLNSAANTTYRIEFFGNTPCDSLSMGGGQIFIGATNVTTDSTGFAQFAANFTTDILPYNATATATDPDNNTSEFSTCRRNRPPNADARGVDANGLMMPDGVDIVRMTDATGSQVAVTLIGSEDITDTRDVDGMIVRYLWTIDGIVYADGDHAAAGRVTLQLAPGTHRVVLTVYDNEGASDEDELIVTILTPNPATFTVTTTMDTNDGTCDTQCSLREAITLSNSTAGLQKIHFNIPFTASLTIQPRTPLPPITDPTIIDGTTQPGFSGKPIIMVNGNLIPNNYAPSEAIVGINIISGGTTVRGLILNGWRYAGIGISAGGGNIIEGNFIGTTVDETNAVPNLYGVIIAGSSNNKIGGTTAGVGNLIAYNNLAGISVTGAARNLIASNTIFANSGLGIDLENNGVTGNDANDADTGANNLQNFPVLTNAFTTNGTLSIVGTLNSASNAAFRIEFFANESCDPSGYGEGQTFIGATNVTTNASADAHFSVNFTEPIGDSITATATDPNNNTSEFSQCLKIIPANGENDVPERNTFPTTAVTLTWNRISWATGYKIEIATDANFDNVEKQVEIPAAQLDYAWTAPSEGKYYWRVQAKDAKGMWRAWSDVESFVALP